MTERESMEVDVVIVGGGPSGLSAAIRLSQLAREAGTSLAIVVLEKGAEIGAHILSGAVFDPQALNALIPNWNELGAPVTTAVRTDQFSILTSTRRLPIPAALLPPMMHNRGKFIISLGELCQWLAAQAEAMGVDIFPGFAATEVLYNEDGSVAGVATGDMGRGRSGEPKSSFAPGMELRARYTLFAEGARGSLTKGLEPKFGLRDDATPQKFGLGIKEVWEVDPAKHREGHVEHTLGWPLGQGAGGGGFLYHAAGNRVNIGLVVHLNYKNPHLSPYEEMQRFKTHPAIAPLLENGQRTSYGARAMTSGGWQSLPKFAFPGGALIGCAAGLVNLPRTKGIHNAMWSGMHAAECAFAAMQQGRSADVLAELDEAIRTGPVGKDLFPARNVKPLVSRFGLYAGMALAGADMWLNTLLGFSPFGTIRHEGEDALQMKRAEEAPAISYARPNGTTTFSRTDSVFLANLSHDEDQPLHLVLKDPSLPIAKALPVYDEPAQRYCPAGVYEIVSSDTGQSLQINAANCLHCKTCDIKEPFQNIDWVPPEGGSGPAYQGM